MTRPRTLVGALLTAATLTLGTAVVPASAATGTFDDQVGDVGHGVDLHRVTVTTGARAVRVTLEHEDLVRAPSSGAGEAVYLDTDGAGGPELALVTGLFDGTDYALLRTRTWRLGARASRVDCPHSVHLDYRGDLTEIRLARRCLPRAATVEEVRVAVRAVAQQGDDRAVDWLGGPRTFTAPVPVS